MPFENEFASYKPLARILDDDKLDKLKDRMKVQSVVDKKPSDYPSYINIDSMQTNSWHPDMVLAIDGSRQSVSVNNGFPGAEIGYVTVASVLILMNKIKDLDKNQFIDPKALRDTEKASAFDSVFPGCNVIIDDAESSRCSLRKLVYEQMNDASPVFSDFETILDTYEVLLKYRSDSGFGKKPMHQLEELEETHEMEYGVGKFLCKYTGKELYSTDALRFHELLNDMGVSGELFGQISFVMERLMLVHILRAFEKKEWLGTLKNVAFILDGPLAVFSVSAWLSTVIKQEIQRINELQKKINGSDMVIIGLEKNGQFVEHFNLIDTAITGERGIFPNRSLLLLDDSYIKKNIIFSKGTKVYGEATYFGRKFFYKTANGYRLVAQTPFLHDDHSMLKTAKTEQFPRIYDICELLDKLVSNRYPNSINPLITAHSEAAIPLSLGIKMFDEIAKEIRDKGN
ncbi:MAG: DNA double-strand break repair nuclease NurA [Defluviitaleaceae bacterium]|nr:DNA double-strand break repair nuclease NurA [Defluviitaleaceae bacterium]